MPGRRRIWLSPNEKHPENEPELYLSFVVPAVSDSVMTKSQFTMIPAIRPIGKNSDQYDFVPLICQQMSIHQPKLLCAIKISKSQCMKSRTEAAEARMVSDTNLSGFNEVDMVDCKLEFIILSTTTVACGNAAPCCPSSISRHKQ